MFQRNRNPRNFRASLSSPFFGALLLAASAWGQTQPFANDPPPKFTFSEHLEQGRVVAGSGDWYDLIYKAPGAPPRVSVYAEFSLAGMDPASFGPATTFSLDAGNLSLAGNLGADPLYAVGKTTAQITLGGDLGSQLPQGGTGTIGFITLDWSGGAVLKVTVQITDCTPAAHIVAQDFEDDNDSFVSAGSPTFVEAIDKDPDVNYLDGVEFIFADRIFADRTVYFSGTQRVDYLADPEKGSDEEEYDTIGISGGLSTPETAIDTPLAGATVWGASAAVAGRVIVEHRVGVDSVLVRVNGGEPVEANVAFPPVADAPNAGFDTWSWTVPVLSLAAGVNTIEAWAIDSEGAESAAVARQITARGVVTPFATDLPAQFTFAERLEQVPVLVPGDGYYLGYKASAAPPRVEVAGQFSLTGMNPATFGPETTFSLLAGNLAVGGKLGDDPQYGPGKTRAKVAIVGDLGSQLPQGATGVLGFIEVDWSDGKTVKVAVRINDCTPDLSVAAWDFEDNDDSFVSAASPTFSELIARDPDVNYVDGVEFIFDDRIFSDRIVYFDGSQEVKYLADPVLDSEEEEYDTIVINGGLSTPTVAIDTPAAGAVIATSTVSVTGRVVLESRVAVDTVLVTVNGGEPVEATLAFPPQTGVPNAGFDTWSWTAAALPVASGSNATVFTVWAVDAEGVESAVVTRRINIPTTSQVRVNVITTDAGGILLSGTVGGTLDNGFPAIKTLPTGTLLTVRATAKPGFRFVGWTGTQTGAPIPPSPSALLTFTAQPNTDIAAVFAELPFRTAAGAYAGLGFPGAGTGKPAVLNVTVSNTGFLSGKLGYGGEQLSFRGQLDDGGHLQVSVPREGGQAAVVALQMDLGGSGSADDTIGAEVTADGASLTFDMARTSGGGMVPPAVTGYYTVVFKRDRTPPYDIYNGPAFPQGHGTAWLRANATGGVSMVGQLADGSRFSFGGVVAGDGSLPVVVPLYAQAGWLAGQLLFRDVPGASDADGVFGWSRPAGVRDLRNFLAGFNLQMATVAAKYTPPAAAARIFPGRTTGTVTAGDAAGPYFAKAVQLTTTNQVVVPLPNPNRLRFVFAPASGFCNGLFVGPDGRSRVFTGVVLQKANAAFGYFPREGQSGYVELQALP